MCTGVIPDLSPRMFNSSPIVVGDSDSNYSCFQFTAKEIRDLTIAKVTVTLTAAFACVVAAAVFVALKEYRYFGNRLVLYLIIAGFFYSLATTLQVAPIHHNGDGVVVRDGLNGLCVVVGFIYQIAAWTFYNIVFWIISYLFVLAVFKYKANSRKHEIIGLVISVVTPFMFNWIPFVHNMYGLAGAWCWIKLTKGNCSDDYVLGLVYQFLLFYGVHSIIIPCTFISLVVILVILCRQKRPRGGQHQSSVHFQAVKEAVPLLVYPTLFSIFLFIMTANRVYYAVAVAKHKDPYYPLWLAHCVADAGRGFIPSFAFLLQANTLRKLRCKKRSSRDADTAYIVPAEFSEADPLIIRDSGSHNKAYRSRGLLADTPESSFEHLANCTT